MSAPKTRIRWLDFLQIVRNDGPFGEMPGSLIKPEEISNILQNALRIAKAFVFSDQVFSVLMEIAKTEKHRVNSDRGYKLDLPFPVSWFEWRSFPILPILVSGGDNQKLGVMGILIIERPNDYVYFAIVEGVEEAFGKVGAIHGVINESNFAKIQDTNMAADFHYAVSKMLEAFRVAHCVRGIQPIYEKVRIKTHNYKDIIYFRDLVHVVLQSEQKTYQPTTENVEINWSHQWEVMGHWRRVDGIGKDRDRKYVVNGFTWVVPHTKGPDGKPLVIKNRFVKRIEIQKKVS